MSNKKLDLSKDLLLELYETMPMSEIAKEMGVSFKTIQRRFREYGIVSKGDSKNFPKKIKFPKAKPPYQNKAKFQEAYSELKSLALVAKRFNISMNTAWTWKTKHNIETIQGVSEYGKAHMNKDKPWADRDNLETMYAKYSARDLAKMWGCDRTVIYDWLRKFNIPTRNLKEQWELKPKTEIPLIHNGNLDIELMSSYKQRMSSYILQKIKETVGKCQACGYDEVLDLHHINEDAYDNRPENHIILCPNCHAKLHRLGKTVEEIAPDYKNWSKYAGGH